MIVAVDFDGTICKWSNDYPDIGDPVPHALETLRFMSFMGVRIVLNTVRDKEGLQKAVDFLKENGVELYGVNENPDQKSYSSSPKIDAALFIDDNNFGIPLLQDKNTGRPYVCWKQVRLYFYKLYSEPIYED